jgi:hypothetical protein
VIPEKKSSERERERERAFVRDGSIKQVLQDIGDSEKDCENRQQCGER